MAYAVMHILAVIIFLDLLRHYVFKKNKFPRYLVVLGGIAGLAPDIDIPLGGLLHLITGKEILSHGTLTHSFLLALAFFAVGIFLHSKKNYVWSRISNVIGVGIFFHILLDCFYGSGMEKFFLWPFTKILSACNLWDLYPYGNHIDAVLLVLWLVHEEVHQKVKDWF
ncbi:metal-dependent hydrolase [Candidatus Woesearchaeota archaeon]|nr:metal-dependent hydrolase [Candidatus Woesearchaeota archaeon]